MFTASDIMEFLNGKRVEGLPVPPDTYREGSTSWGKDPKRGRAIINARARKRNETNKATLISLIDSLTFADRREALSAAQILEHNPLAVAHGWQYWQKDNAASWVHESETEKLAKCQEIGAKRTI